MKNQEMMEKKALDGVVDEMKKMIKSMGKVKVISVELMKIIQMKVMIRLELILIE